MSESFEDNLDAAYYSTSHQSGDMQIMRDELNAEKEEFQHFIGKSAKYDCVFCITSFTRKDSLLRHMREVHSIFQPY